MRCVFGDDSRFTQFHSDGRARVRLRQGEGLIDVCIQPMDGNHGPWIMVWGTHQDGRSELVNASRVFRDGVFTWATGVSGRKLYVQDNATPHTARDTAVFLAEQDVEFMGWPAGSPYLNPIEYVWDQMRLWTRDMDDPTSTLPELRHAVLLGWAAVRPRRVTTLVERMPRRIRALFATRGCRIRYYEWCDDMDVGFFNRFIKKMAYSPIWSWRHYLNVLFFHCGVALTLFFVSLSVAGTFRD